MPISYNTGDWFALQPDTYRKLDLCSPIWPLDLDFECKRVVGAPYGGPLAIVRDPALNTSKSTSKLVIRIHDTAGQELSRIEWDHGTLIAMGWSDTEDLLCIQENAIVFTYDIFGKETGSFNMGEEASLTGITDARVYQCSTGVGVAVMTTNGRIFTKLCGSKDIRVRQLPEIPKSQSDCSSWEIISEERNSYCLVARDCDLIRLFPGETVGTVTRNLFEKPFERIIIISASYNHKNLALYTNNGLLWLGTSDLKRKFCEFDTGRKDIPRQIEWIMNTDSNDAHAVIIAYRSYLLIVNRNGDKNTLSYDPEIFLVAEMDGVRVITFNSYEMIQRLPSCVQHIFAINSQEPASFLFEAHRKYQEKSHEADEYLGLIGNRLDIAITECIKAAAQEFCIDTQKSLMKTAYYGKGFSRLYNPIEYINVLRILRVLNALRNPKVAMPITYNQFTHLKSEVVLSRLVARKHYAMAIQISKHLKLRESWIFEHWAYHKIMTDKDDREVARKITEKFKNPSIKGISFCNIAEKAHQVKRDELAMKLLDLEPSPALKVPLFIKLADYSRAVASATQSGDPELIAGVLLHIKQKMTLYNFHMLIREYNLALNVYKKMIQDLNPSALLDIFSTEDDHKSIAEHYLHNAIETDGIESNIPIIVSSYKQAWKQLEAEICSEHGRMLKVQKTLTAKYNSTYGAIPFYGMTINDTLNQLLQMGELKEAVKLKADFQVPDKRFYIMRIHALARCYKWEELEKLAKLKKLPCGYEPIVEACLEHKNISEVKKYIPKCRIERRAHLYIKADLLEEAAECAFEQHDVQTLSAIQQKAALYDRRELLEKIVNYVSLLSARR